MFQIQLGNISWKKIKLISNALSSSTLYDRKEDPLLCSPPLPLLEEGSSSLNLIPYDQSCPGHPCINCLPACLISRGLLQSERQMKHSNTWVRKVLDLKKDWRWRERSLAVESELRNRFMFHRIIAASFPLSLQKGPLRTLCDNP